MFKKNIFKLFITLQVCLLVIVTIGVSAPTPAKAAAIKIMPLGDSITGSPGCWRALLWNRLKSAGYTNIDFVGTLNNPNDCGIAFDANNEGHGGYLATNIANQNLLPVWLSATTPDIVVMHLGTNDVWNNIAPATILNAFSTLVNQMRANNPNVKILVAKILPMNPSGCSDCPQRVINFNAAIPAWASSKSTSQSPITVVDQWTGFSTSADTVDGVHPNNTTGIQKVSDKWYPALVAVLSGSPNPTTTPVRTATPFRTATQGAATATPIRTATQGGTGSTCSPVNAIITAPFVKDGAGTFCWQSSNLGGFINSWNLTSLTVNGINYINVWASTSSLPAKINGFWYVGYTSTVAWGHFEAK